MKFWLFFLLVSAVFGLAACKSSKKTAENLNAPFVELKTSGCFGFCPVFRLTFFGNRHVEFEGINFTAQTGIKTFELTADELTKLRAKVAATNVWQYPDRFESTIQDAPGATITVWDGERKKSTQGTMDRPQALLDLQALMTQLGENHGLNLTRGVDPKAPQPGARAEVIVKLEEKLNAGNWIRQFEDLRLQLVRRIPPENMWVVAYDTTQVEQETLLELFRATVGVILAQPNLKSEERD